jgi:hypothetical protein
MLDDRAEMVEALHERVLALLGETPDDAVESCDTVPQAASAPGQLRLL